MIYIAVGHQNLPAPSSHAGQLMRNAAAAACRAALFISQTFESIFVTLAAVLMTDAMLFRERQHDIYF